MPVDGQPTAFLIGQAYPAAQVRAEDAVFFDQVGHGVLLPPVEPADQRASSRRSDIASGTARESIPPTRSQAQNPSAEQ